MNESFDIRPTEDTIGMIMGAKEIAIEGEDYILMPIAVRGGDYEAEWASNVTLGAEGEAEGFSGAVSVGSRAPKTKRISPGWAAD